MLGALLAAFSLVQTPLPQPDFHNIRHHDSPGELCEYHDHLLRWHPSAGVASDVAVLHWHWFVPTADPSDPLPEDSGRALHAHLPITAIAPWDGGPSLTAVEPSWSSPTARLIDPVAPSWSASLLPLPSSPAAGFSAAPCPGCAPAARSAQTLRATLSRWVC